MRRPMGALQWWGADDHSWAPKIPIHGGASAVHPSYDDANCTQRDACRRAAGLPGTHANYHPNPNPHPNPHPNPNPYPDPNQVP